MRRIFLLALALLTAATAACSGGEDSGTSQNDETAPVGTVIRLSDSGVTVDGTEASTDPAAAVYTANDIVFYLEGQGFTYGAGDAGDEHSQAEADAHTVVHITRPGTYVLSGELSAGQIAVDLGEKAKEDSDAVVTLVLDGVDITCTVAPAVIFYHVYECGSDDADTASMDVDTAAAGANVVIADGTENHITGSYVARIYKSYTLSEDGTEVVDNKKLHKYDGAFYSKMSMNVDGGELGTGRLFITAENEGLDAELHLTINGGRIDIVSGNDGINTNEDGVSVTTINGGILNIRVDGSTGEGDGIDSNGWLVVNGGTVTSMSCSSSMDGGLDADMGVYINGGTVLASGNMYDPIDGGGQAFAVFSFAQRQKGGQSVTLKDAKGNPAAELCVENDYTYLVYSAPELTAGDYTLWQGETQLAGSAGMSGGFGGRGMGGGRPEDWGDRELHQGPPDGFPADREPPEGIPERGEFPGRQEPEHPEGQMPPEGGGPRWNGREEQAAERSEIFTLTEAGGMFGNIAPAE